MTPNKGVPVIPIGTHTLFGRLLGDLGSLRASDLHTQATRAALKCADVGPHQVDAVTVGQAMNQDVGLDPDRINADGGARLVPHQALAVQSQGGGTGVVALCGGGQGEALILKAAQ